MMLKRLRRRFVLVTTTSLSLLLLIFLIVICTITWKQMEDDIDTALKSAIVIPHQPGTSETEDCSHLPCFILRQGSDGQLHALGHAYYDLSDQPQLEQLLAEAQQTGKTSGTLRDRNLRFLQRTVWGKEEYVFADISDQLITMHNLVLICCSVLVLAVGIFLAISYLLARWMAQPVKQAWSKQRQFVADASHELKTPLTVIMTNAQMLQSREYDEAANARLTNGIVAMSDQMRGLTEALLELAKADAQPNSSQVSDIVDLSQQTENSTLHFEPVYFEANRQLCANIQPGIHVRGNAQSLQQVVDILLDNGQKYSAPGSTVSLTLTQSRSHCTLRISSQGQALTNQQCKDIFQRFYRLDEVRTRSRSYGLGLPIAQSLVQQHRGKIWAQSKDGINTFFVTLPTCNPEK